jgi:hypothetical protein
MKSIEVKGIEYPLFNSKYDVNGSVCWLKFSDTEYIFLGDCQAIWAVAIPIDCLVPNEGNPSIAAIESAKTVI